MSDTALHPVPVLDRATARAIVEDGIARYVEARHARVAAFVDRHFNAAGALRLHRAALGFDLLRAPANVALGFATIGKNATSAGLRLAGRKRAGNALAARNLFLETAVGREVQWRVMTELLELPMAQRRRRSERDALMETILADPRLVAHFTETLEALGRRGDDAAFRTRLMQTMAAYVGSRAAAADLSSSLFAAAAGLAAYQQFTPGMTTLSASVAATVAHKSAVAGFTLGPWLGGIYYSVFSASTPPLLYAGVFAGMMLPLAALTAFAGIVADPLQRRLGLHQRRLHRMVDALGAALRGDDARFSVHDHYAARMLDFVDWSFVVLRLARS
ncbi:MAG: hypothetical protein KIT16_22215 [Rhodospirillaceae bacterium]|nr:hypothetical protein [Rhodospirillaceae bacterium]